MAATAATGSCVVSAAAHHPPTLALASTEMRPEAEAGEASGSESAAGDESAAGLSPTPSPKGTTGDTGGGGPPRAAGGATARQLEESGSASNVVSSSSSEEERFHQEKEEKVSLRSAVWRRRRVPAQLPFALARCRQCKRAKQGAVFCRVVRRHREDGWQPPAGFLAWLEAWEASHAGEEDDDDEEASDSARGHSGSASNTTHGEKKPALSSSGSRGLAARRRGGEFGGASGSNGSSRQTKGEERKRARLPELGDASTRVFREPTKIWAPPPDDVVASGRIHEAALEAYVRSRVVTEEAALETLLECGYDVEKAVAVDGAAASFDVDVPAAAECSFPADSDQDPLRAASEAMLAAAAWMGGPRNDPESDGGVAGHPGFARAANVARFSETDVAKFGEVLLDCDRDCRQAWKKVRRMPPFQGFGMADVLGVYYGRLKPSPRYLDFKRRLDRRRIEARGWDEHDQDPTSSAVVVARDAKKQQASIAPAWTALYDDEDLLSSLPALLGETNLKPPKLGGSRASSASGGPVALSRQYSSDIPPEDVFDCPCGCGRQVDNRGRAASHRRKWATRGCRERAARFALGGKAPDDAIPRTASMDDDDHLAGTVLDNSHHHHQQQRKRARPDNRADEPPSDASPRNGGKQRLVLVHAGVLVAADVDGTWRAGQVRGRCVADPTRWDIDFFPCKNEADAARSSSSSSSDDDDDGDDDDDEAPANEKKLAPPTRAMTALEIADALASSPAQDNGDDKADDEKKYRGVTCKKYGDASRYNAAFSLLGDRFSLGGFDTADQAAVAWDVVAWRSGRDDLNLLPLDPPARGPPTKDDLKRLAKQLRDNMRLRGLNSSHLRRLTVDLDAVDPAQRKLAVVVHGTDKTIKSVAGNVVLAPRTDAVSNTTVRPSSATVDDLPVRSSTTTTTSTPSAAAAPAAAAAPPGSGDASPAESDREPAPPSAAEDDRVVPEVRASEEGDARPDDDDDDDDDEEMPPNEGTPHPQGEDSPDNCPDNPNPNPVSRKRTRTEELDDIFGSDDDDDDGPPPKKEASSPSPPPRETPARAPPNIGPALFAKKFETTTGAALVLHDAVYVVSAQLSRRWLVERFDDDQSDAKKQPPPALEISAADLQRAGAKSFALLSRGQLPPAHKAEAAKLDSVLRFLEAELVGRALLDADNKKLPPRQRDRVVVGLKLRPDLGVILADTASRHKYQQHKYSTKAAGENVHTTSTNNADLVEYDLEALRRAVARYAAQPQLRGPISPPARKKSKATPPASPAIGAAAGLDL